MYLWLSLVTVVHPPPKKGWLLLKELVVAIEFVMFRFDGLDAIEDFEKTLMKYLCMSKITGQFRQKASNEKKKKKKKRYVLGETFSCFLSYPL
jgi:hypothetical protein